MEIKDNVGETWTGREFGEEGRKEGMRWNLKLGGLRKDEGDILDFAPPPKAGGETRPAYAGVPGALLPVSPTLTYRIIQHVRIGPLGGPKVEVKY